MRDYYELIEDYKQNALSSELRQEFEDAMLQDDQLKLAVENHSIVEEALDLLLEEDIRGEISKLNQEEEPKRIFHLFPILRTCAAIGLILVASYASVNYLANQRYSHEEVRKRHFVPLVNPDATRSAETPEELLEKGIYQFDLSQYEKSKNFLLEALQNDLNQEDTERAYLYMGVIDYINQDYTSALNHFEKTSSDLKHQYRAQIYLIQNNTMALKQLQKDHPSKQIDQIVNDTEHWMYKWKVN